MIETVEIVVDGVPRRVERETTLAAALLGQGVTSFRRDGNGAPRAPLCGMGSCFECRVVVDGLADVRSCLVVVREGMRVETSR